MHFGLVWSMDPHFSPLMTDTEKGEYQGCISEPTEDPSTDPVSYYFYKSKVWPYLAIVAMHMRSCALTGMPSKHVFLTTGNILSPHYTQLTPKLVEQLMVPKVWPTCLFLFRTCSHDHK